MAKSEFKANGFEKIVRNYHKYCARRKNRRMKTVLHLLNASSQFPPDFRIASTSRFQKHRFTNQNFGARNSKIRIPNSNDDTISKYQATIVRWESQCQTFDPNSGQQFFFCIFCGILHFLDLDFDFAPLTIVGLCLIYPFFLERVCKETNPLKIFLKF